MQTELQRKEWLKILELVQEVDEKRRIREVEEKTALADITSKHIRPVLPLRPHRSPALSLVPGRSFSGYGLGKYRTPQLYKLYGSE